MTSETLAARNAVSRTSWAIGDVDARVGLLLGRPNADHDVGTAAWVLYESGDIVLRRSRNELEVASALVYHLASLHDASRTPHLAMRLRPVVLADGGVVLIAPAATSDLAGHDRRLARKGATVLPTVIAVIDTVNSQVILPAQSIDPQVPSGVRPLRGILLASTSEPFHGDASTALGLARAVLRSPTLDVHRTVDHIGRLSSIGPVHFLEQGAIRLLLDEWVGASSTA